MEPDDRFEAELSRGLKRWAEHTRPPLDIRGYVMRRASRQERLLAGLGALLPYAGAACLAAALALSPAASGLLSRAIGTMGEDPLEPRTIITTLSVPGIVWPLAALGAVALAAGLILRRRR